VYVAASHTFCDVGLLEFESLSFEFYIRARVHVRPSRCNLNFVDHSIAISRLKFEFGVYPLSESCVMRALLYFDAWVS